MNRIWWTARRIFLSLLDFRNLMVDPVWINEVELKPRSQGSLRLGKGFYGGGGMAGWAAPLYVCLELWSQCPLKEWKHRQWGFPTQFFSISDKIHLFSVLTYILHSIHIYTHIYIYIYIYTHRERERDTRSIFLLWGSHCIRIVSETEMDK